MSADTVRHQGVVPPEGIPEVLRRPEVAGVFIGGCVARGLGSSFRAQAHAHTSGEHLGWICIRGWRRLYQRQLLLHELAHVITRQGHTDRWRNCLRELGGRVEAQCRKRVRKPCACGKHRFGNEGSTHYTVDDTWHSWARCHRAGVPALKLVPLTKPRRAPAPDRAKRIAHRRAQVQRLERRIKSLQTRLAKASRSLVALERADARAQRAMERMMTGREPTAADVSAVEAGSRP